MNKKGFEVGFLMKFLLAMLLLFTAILVIIFIGGQGQNLIDMIADMLSFGNV
jgi:hypothetical protein